LIGPLLLGASLGNGSIKLFSTLQEFGRNLGIAFQIKDDLLGVFGKEQEMGKSPKSDIEEGKATLLLFYAKEKSNKAQKRILNSYGKGKISDQDLVKIRGVFTETGAFDYAHSTALEYVDKAKGLIPRVTQDSELRQLLEEMADLLINRES
jgi:geranylgeranyl diphosphate synthase type I